MPQTMSSSRAKAHFETAPLQRRKRRIRKRRPQRSFPRTCNTRPRLSGPATAARRPQPPRRPGSNTPVRGGGKRYAGVALAQRGDEHRQQHLPRDVLLRELQLTELSARAANLEPRHATPAQNCCHSTRKTNMSRRMPATIQPECRARRGTRTRRARTRCVSGQCQKPSRASGSGSDANVAASELLMAARGGGSVAHATEQGERS